jgi:hypothetical protein
MREGMHEPVSVLAGYSDKDKKFRPLIVTWQGVDYRLGKIDFYHKTKNGATTLHHFSLADKKETLYMRLQFDSASLHWTLEEYQMSGMNNSSL